MSLNFSKIEFMNNPPLILTVPSNPGTFRLDWERSKFLDCLNMDMKRADTKRLIPLEKTVLFKKVIEFFEKRGKTVFLMCGSLLGLNGL